MPSGWPVDGSWSATPSANGHATVGLYGGNVGDGNDTDYNCVALQVL